MKNRLFRLWVLGVLVVGLLVVAGSAGASSTGITTLVSRNTNGTQGNGVSRRPSISADGRYVAFDSAASNLVSGDSDGLTDVFVYDRTTSQTTLASWHDDGGNGSGALPSISADGRYVAFQSSSALVDEDTNDTVDIYVHDRQTSQTTLVSRHTGGALGNDVSTEASISADGQVVAFLSAATTLIDNDTNGQNDVFIHDRTTGQTTLATRHTNGTQANFESFGPVLSGSGRYVAFTSHATNLADEDTVSNTDIFRHDRLTGQTILVTQTPPVLGGLHSEPSISADGQRVAFTTRYPDECGDRIYVRDLQTGAVMTGSQHTGGGLICQSTAPSLSADGRHVAFVTTEFLDFPNWAYEVYQHDLLLDETHLISVAWNTLTLPGNDDALDPTVSGDGQFTAFAAIATDLIAADANGFQDVFLREQPYAISGVVQDESGNPAAGVRVYVVGQPGASDWSEADGTYRIPGFAPGQYTVKVESDDTYYFTNDIQVVTVPPHATSVNFSGVLAPVVVFEPSADAFVESFSPTTNYGGDEFLYVWKQSTTDTTFEQRPYLKFDVTGLPACAQVIEANLQLTVASESPQGGQLYATGNNWTEMGITWNNAPSITGSPIANLGAVEDGGVEWIDVRPAVTGNGTYSFALKDGVADEAVYWSRDNTVSDPSYVPMLHVRARAAAGGPPTAAFTGAPLAGLAPLAVSFTDQSTGCPTAWAWTFGDGGTSTARHPGHTYTAPGTYTVTLTATNAQGSDGETKTAYVTVSAPPVSPSLYVSPATAATIGGVAATPQDILFRNGPANTWTMHFDGSDVGVTKPIVAFAWLANGDLLLTLKANQSLPGIGAVTPWDVVRFTPTSLGNNTAGTFSWHIDGSDVGLTTAAEKIDALDALSDGRVLVSTGGALAVPKSGGGTLKMQDEDVAAFTLTATGAMTTGTWALYFNGTAIPGMSAEDVAGVTVDEATGHIYVAITGAFNVGGVSGNGKDVLKLTPSGGGYSIAAHWRGSQNGLAANLAGMEIVP